MNQTYKQQIKKPTFCEGIKEQILLKELEKKKLRQLEIDFERKALTESYEFATRIKGGGGDPIYSTNGDLFPVRGAFQRSLNFPENLLDVPAHQSLFKSASKIALQPIVPSLATSNIQREHIRNNDYSVHTKRSAYNSVDKIYPDYNQKKLTQPFVNDYTRHQFNEKNSYLAQTSKNHLAELKKQMDEEQQRKLNLKKQEQMADLRHEEKYLMYLKWLENEERGNVSKSQYFPPERAICKDIPTVSYQNDTISQGNQQADIKLSDNAQEKISEKNFKNIKVDDFRGVKNIDVGDNKNNLNSRLLPKINNEEIPRYNEKNSKLYSNIDLNLDNIKNNIKGQNTLFSNQLEYIKHHLEESNQLKEQAIDELKKLRESMNIGANKFSYKIVQLAQRNSFNKNFDNSIVFRKSTKQLFFENQQSN